MTLHVTRKRRVKHASVAQPPDPKRHAVPASWLNAYVWADILRRMQGNLLTSLGFGARSCGNSAVAEGELWRLYEYDDAADGVPLLIVSAPIKRPYIWDLAPSHSVIRLCLAAGIRPFLLEWLPSLAHRRQTGIDAYARVSLEAAIRAVAHRSGAAKPLLIGHSLGGTLAAIYAGYAGENLRGLVLLGTPLCFSPRSSRFRDALVSALPRITTKDGEIPGALLAHLCIFAAPEIFVWPRFTDMGQCVGDIDLLATLARVERWALDETPLSASLFEEIFESLYRRNQFQEGRLEMNGRRLGPETLCVPTLAVVNRADDVAPTASIKPFLDRMPQRHCSLIEYDGEAGVGLQHLAILIGRSAQMHVWPRIFAWMHAQSETCNWSDASICKVEPRS